jgi:hypothetical protein
MNRISISEAWAYATSFFSDQMASHAIILIGVGIAVPLVLQLLFGNPAAMDPAMLASGGAMAAFGITAFLLAIVAFIIQVGSYYASWRIGFEPGRETLGSALQYGLVAALPVLLVTIGFVLVIGLIFALLFGGAMLPVLMGGGAPSDGAALGALGMMGLALPLFLVVGLWLSARLCVMGPVMAASRSFNPLTALAQSWRMTAASQWKLMGYFVLLGIAFFVLAMIVGMVFGLSLLAGGPDGGGSVAMVTILGAIVGIPVAYLYVGIPAGIYRALGGDKAADIFT